MSSRQLVGEDLDYRLLQTESSSNILFSSCPLSVKESILVSRARHMSGNLEKSLENPPLEDLMLCKSSFVFNSLIGANVGLRTSC